MLLSKAKITITSLLLGYSALAAAQTHQQSQDVWFVDHLNVAPSKQVAINYAFPSKQHSIICMQDPSGSQLASVEWKYKGYAFKGQIKDMYQRVSLSRDDHPTPWMLGGKTQLADAAGTMIISNLDDSAELTFSCVYETDTL